MFMARGGARVLIVLGHAIAAELKKIRERARHEAAAGGIVKNLSRFGRQAGKRGRRGESRHRGLGPRATRAGVAREPPSPAGLTNAGKCGVIQNKHGHGGGSTPVATSPCRRNSFPD